MPSPLLPLPHDVVCVRETPAACPKPEERIRWVARKPEGIGAAPSGVLGSMADNILPKHGLGDDPAMRIERRNAETDGELVVLISELLELVDAAFPESRELDLHPSPGNDAICLRV